MSTIINATTTNGVVIQPDNSGILQLQTAGTTAVTVDASQNVGINATDMTVSGKNAKLAVVGNVNLDDDNFIAWGGGTSRPTFAGNKASNYMYWSTSGTERMRIDSGGKVFIGATSITTGYSYAGAALIIGGSAAPLIKWQSTNGPKAWDSFIDSGGTNLYWAYNGTDKAYINASTGAWTTTSDLRAKKDITDINYGLNAVMELRPVSYLMNEDEDTSKKHLGFIAQEVKEIIDEAVDDIEEGKMYGFDKSGLVPVLVKAIQEQQTIINDLKARVETLEAK